MTDVAADGLSFKYNTTFTGLAPSGPGVYGAFATNADGGFQALSADWSDPDKPLLYATTSGTFANRLYQITGGTGSASNNNGAPPVFVTGLLATAAPGTAFRGVALAPTAAGTTATTTTLSASSSSDYATGLSLSATVTPTTGTGTPTGWVSFRNSATGAEIGVAPLINGSASFTTSGNLAPGHL